MTTWISQELTVINLERLDMWCARIGLPCDKLWPFEFLESIRFQFRASRYIMRLNRTFVWQVMTTWISQVLPVFNLERLDMWCARIGLPCDKLWSFEFLESIRCSISSILLYYAPESDFCVTCYDHLNFAKASGFQFRAPQYVMRQNRTSVWQVMIILISRELPDFKLERLDMWCAWIGLPCDKWWAFEFLESFRF